MYKQLINNYDTERIKENISTELAATIRSEELTSANGTSLLFENIKSEWLTTKEAALYLRKFLDNGEPSENAIHKLVANGTIRRRKFAGRLYFKKVELGYLIETSLK